ncbi:hypothetical protein GGP94_003158 [Salinibacter ruber]|uniref:hypothetical protein n=1 Tax=Salinibacter ruber TaxID=146919 RepID=UPI00216A6FA7|nr:hypothetical protein [Salinibacter ruber]MCS4162710.1 hypothetical protein [Salinibacter ruber]
MAQQYEIGATGLNGIPYRIEIWNQQYTGSTVTDLLADGQMIRFEGGQRERVGLQPIWGKEVRINVRTDKDLSPLFGLQDRDAEVRVFRTDTSSLVWKGFILTDFFQDEPRTALPGVELRAVDGLTTLEGDSFDALSGVSDSDIGEDGSFISYTDLFTGILSTLYDSPLDVEFAVEWYPDAGGQLTSSDNPLRYSGARPDVYYDSEDGAWFDQQGALEDALKSQGLEIRQAVIGGDLTWLVAQPTALSSGSVKTWRYAPGGTEDTSSPFTRDLSLDLSSADTNRPTREFERRSESVSVTHDHTPIENLVGDDGYEEIGKGNASGWQIDNAATSYIDASILNHDNADASSVGTPDPTPSSLQQDTYVLEVRGSSQNNAVEYPISQDLGDISGIPPETALKFSHQLWHEPFEQQPSNGDQPHLYAELEIGGFYLKEFEAGVRQSVKGGSGTLPVQSLDRAIPNGTKLPLYNRTDSPPDQIPRAFITLSERADKGDTVLVGDISRDVDSKWSVAYLGFTSTAYDFALWRWTKNPNSWGRVEARAFAKDPNGQPLSGNATLRIGGAALYGETNAGSVVDRPAFVDDVTVQLTQQGNELTATTKEGTVSENGQSRDLSVLLSSGPTSLNARRIKGVGPSSDYEPTNWGVGVGGGSLSLAGLQARERLRYLREHLERQQLTVYARDKSPVVTGEEIVQFDGKTWRIAEFSSDPASGEIGLTLIQHADAGTTDLSIATVRDTEDSGTSGGGGTSAAVGGGGGVSTWDDLSDKPTVLTPPGFSAGDFPSAEQLASADIASALSHSPGLSGGIQTTVRASATDDALVTEQAVAEKLEVAQEDRELISSRLVQTQADIDALDAVTVRRSRELIAGNAIGPLGDLSKDRTVTVQEEDLAGTFLAPDGSGALAVQTTGDLVGDGSGKMQIGQSVVQTREIDESIAPTWTGVHTHAADIEMQSQQVRFDDGVLQGDGNGALEVLKADESNQGVLRVDEIVAHTVTVVDEIDQRNVNDLRVEDQYIVVNENQSGTPGLDGGLVAERGGLEDAYIEWEEGLDVWGTRLENGTLKPITLRDTSMADTGIPYWNQQEERIETDSDLKFLADQSQPFEEDPAGKVQTKAGIGHPDYLTEKQHWYITPGGLGDFRTLLADELRVEAFIAEVEEALAGSDFLTKSFATLDQPFSLPSSSPVGTQKDLTVQDLDGLGATPVFGNDTSQQDDTLRLRITDRSGGGLTVADVWLRCIAGSYTDNGDGTQTWTVEILQAGDAGIGAELTAPEGSVVLDYGVPGDFLIERSVLNPDSGDIAPYDRMLAWKDNDGDRIPDDYEVLNLRGRLDGLSKAYASGFGTYTETARFTSDIIVGDIEAGAAGDQTGSYLRFSDSDGLEVVYGDGFDGTGDGRLSSAVLQLEEDVRLLAKEQLQEGQARAGLETRVGEQAATLRLTAKYQENESELRLRADDATSRIELDAAKTLIDSSLTLTQTDFDTGSVTIRVNAGGDTSQFPTTRPDGSGSLPKKGDGGPLRVGDMLIDTGDGDKPYTWTGSTWTDSYTKINGDDITTGTIDAKRIDVENIQISNLAGAGDYQTKSENNVVVRGSYGGTSNFPADRPSSKGGGDWQDGDVVIDTQEGDKPYTYDGTSPYDASGWTQSYTAIDGGNINTNTIELDRLSFANAEEGYIDAQYLNITASDLTINSNTTFFGGSGIPGDALQGDYTSLGDESQTFRQSSPAPTNDDANGRDLQKGDVWIDTSDGNAPHVYTGSGWEASNTDIPGGFLADDYTVKGSEAQTFRQSEPPTDSDASGRDLQTGDLWIDTDDGDNPHTYDGTNDQWEAAYTNIDGGDITTGTISLNRIDFTVENGKIAAEDLAITASDLTISGSSKSDVKNAVLQLEDDVRLLAENLTQEQEARAGLELTASETEARFEADVKFAGNTAAISLLANDDGSSARLAGDSIILDGDTIITGSLTMDNTNDPNGEITNSAGDFSLDQNGLSLSRGGSSGNKVTFTDSGTESGYINLNNTILSDALQFVAHDNLSMVLQADQSISLISKTGAISFDGDGGQHEFGQHGGIVLDTEFSGGTSEFEPVLKFNGNTGTDNTIFDSHPQPDAGNGIIYLYRNGSDVELYAATTNSDGSNYNKNKIAG